MNKITYVKGDATSPVRRRAGIIPHVCNNKHGWGAGFVLAISAKWPEPEAFYLQNECELGTVQFVQVESGEQPLWVANMIAQDGFRSKSNPTPLRYDHLKNCWKNICDFASIFNADLYFPKFGAGLAGGDWERIAEMIEVITPETIGLTCYTLSTPTS